MFAAWHSSFNINSSKASTDTGSAVVAASPTPVNTTTITTTYQYTTTATAITPINSYSYYYLFSYGNINAVPGTRYIISYPGTYRIQVGGITYSKNRKTALAMFQVRTLGLTFSFADTWYDTAVYLEYTALFIIIVLCKTRNHRLPYLNLACTRSTPSAILSPLRAYSPINPIRTADPFWGQTSQFSSVLDPERDCGSKGVNCRRDIYIYIYFGIDPRVPFTSIWKSSFFLLASEPFPFFILFYQ